MVVAFTEEANRRRAEFLQARQTTHKEQTNHGMNTRKKREERTKYGKKEQNTGKEKKKKNEPK